MKFIDLGILNPLGHGPRERWFKSTHRDKTRVSYKGDESRIMSVFQTEDEGSIPSTRSIFYYKPTSLTASHQGIIKAESAGIPI